MSRVETSSTCQLNNQAVRDSANPHQQETFYSVDCSPDGKLLAVGGKFRRLALRDAVTHEIVTTLPIPRNSSYQEPSINSVCFSHDGKKLACGLQNEMMLLEVPSLRLIASFPGLRGPVVSVAFSPDDGNLIGVSQEGTTQLANLKVMGVVGDLVGETGRLISGRFSADGKILAVSSETNGIRLLRAQQLKY